jgi:1,2-diacylglycerol 3-beta-glucosyltransferase
MLRVLIIEDEAVLATTLELLIEDAGHRVVGWALDGAQARRLAAEHRPHLALVDIQLRHGDDGVAVARDLTEQLGVQVIFLTAQSDPNTKARAQQVAHHAYVIKPYVETDLMALIGQVAKAVEGSAEAGAQILPGD